MVEAQFSAEMEQAKKYIDACQTIKKQILRNKKIQYIAK